MALIPVLVQKRLNLNKWFMIACLNKNGQAETFEYSARGIPFSNPWKSRREFFQTLECLSRTDSSYFL
jgi:hypothetical protein